MSERFEQFDCPLSGSFNMAVSVFISLCIKFFM